MTYIGDLHDYRPEDAPVVKEFIDQGRLKEIKKVIESLVDDEFERLDEYANEHISQVAAQRAEKFLMRVLNGDDEAAMELIGDKSDHERIHLCGPDMGKPWASLIHGTLFETGGIKLRRKIVEAHQDLLKDERAKDLQSIVDGLTLQVRKLEAEVDRLRSELR